MCTILFVVWFFKNSILLCNPCWSGIYGTGQEDLELRKIFCLGSLSDGFKCSAGSLPPKRIPRDIYFLGMLLPFLYLCYTYVLFTCIHVIHACYLHVFMLYIHVHTHHGTPVKIRGQLLGVGASFPPCGSQRLNSGHKASCSFTP